jgi:hypothetical protein
MLFDFVLENKETPSKETTMLSIASLFMLHEYFSCAFIINVNKKVWFSEALNEWCLYNSFFPKTKSSFEMMYIMETYAMALGVRMYIENKRHKSIKWSPSFQKTTIRLMGFDPTTCFSPTIGLYIPRKQQQAVHLTFRYTYMHKFQVQI